MGANNEHLLAEVAQWIIRNAEPNAHAAAEQEKRVGDIKRLLKPLAKKIGGKDD